MNDPLAAAIHRCAEYGGGELIEFHADWDKATVRLGSPGIFDGLVIAQWREAKRPAGASGSSIPSGADA
ncbi:hypothetical protein MOKP38_45500 [Mycobacterium avium subsp. hominissuis]